MYINEKCVICSYICIKYIKNINLIINNNNNNNNNNNKTIAIKVEMLATIIYCY